MPRYFTTAPVASETEIVGAIRQWSYPLDSKANLDPLFSRIGDARIVMLGEASHGTHEYYRWRAYITRRLIEEKGFNFIAVEGDWPDCYRLNRFVKGYDSTSKGAFKVLLGFDRWPSWMWANWETVALAEFLLEFNKGKAAAGKVGFYGLDVYSLWESIEAIVEYMKREDPGGVITAEEALRCFEPYRRDEGQSYARATRFVPDVCKTEVLQLLKTIRQRSQYYDGDREQVFSTEQNARIAVEAEAYYQAMIEGGPHSWNLRDRHMADTLERLLDFHGADAKAVVWAHNTHVGDARATDMTDEGMYNIGELARIRHHDKGVVLVGFGSYKGSVIAGKAWGKPLESMELPPARKGSWEYYLHSAARRNALLIMDDFTGLDTLMEHRVGHRAVGVVYNPLYEAYGNYVPSILPARYDAFIYLDETRALHPLHVAANDRTPETYPFGV